MIGQWKAFFQAGTDTFRQRSINDLSGGQRQRFGLQMALAQRTDIIF